MPPIDVNVTAPVVTAPVVTAPVVTAPVVTAPVVTAPVVKTEGTALNVAAAAELAAAVKTTGEAATAAKTAYDAAVTAGKTGTELEQLKAAKDAADKAALDATGKAKDAAGDKGSKGAPEKYADFKTAEGAALDPELATEFGTIAKELDLSQDGAQKLVDLQVKAVNKLTASITDNWVKTVTGWLDVSKADKEYGGANWDKTLQDANRFLNAVGDPELRAMLNSTGTGNSLPYIRAFAKAGKAMADDKFHFGNAVDTGPKPGTTEHAAKVFYPSMQPK